MPPQKPLISTEYTGNSGVKYILDYYETDSFAELPQDKITQCYAVAFNNGKMVIVHGLKKDTWGLVGGSVEEGETIEETLIREIREESNMRVLKYQPIGYQICTDTTGVQKPFYQLRYFAIVEPIGEFVSDPAGSVDKIAQIDPADVKKYFDWKEIGDSIIKRGVGMLNSHLLQK